MSQLHITSPLIRSEPLSSLTGVEVYLKLDNIQPSGSFKIRGLGHHVLKAVTERGSTSLVSSSGGNAGMAVAYIGQKLGLPATIVVPQSTPGFMIDKLKSYGATVEQYGRFWDEAHAKAIDLSIQTPGSFLVHPFDHPEIWEGHKTIVEELIQQLPSEPSAIVCSVGGGGLITGIFNGLEESVWPSTSVLSVETDGAASFAQCIRTGTWAKLEAITSIAKTLGALQVAEAAYNITHSKRRLVDAFTVSDAEAVLAIERFLDDHRILLEPACSATLAALYTPHVREALLAKIDKSKPLVIFVCGGNIITHDLLLQYQADLLPPK